MASDQHYFVALQGRRANLFGWVTSVNGPISAEEIRESDRASLRARLGDDAEIDLPPLEWYARYLEAVARYPDGTPMACDFREVRLPGAQKRYLNVHRVFFCEEDGGE